MEKDLVIGALGQIGTALYKCYEDEKPLRVDKEGLVRSDSFIGDDTIRCMHISIPFLEQEDFIKTVIDYCEEYSPRILMIHSTVAVGTSRLIYDKLQKGEGKVIVVHSCVRGKHPDLYESIKFVFTKIYGVLPDLGTVNSEVSSVMKSLFKKIMRVHNPEDSEFGKLYSTTQYLWQIALVTAIKKDVGQYNGLVNFDTVYNFFNETYNEGYGRMDMSQFTRPILEPCEDDKIGGHCIIQNLKLLRKYGNDCSLLNPPMDEDKYYLK